MKGILKNIDSLEEIEIDVNWEDLKLQSELKGLKISGLIFSALTNTLIVYGYKQPNKRVICNN